MKFKGFVLNDSQKIYISGSDKKEYVASIESVTPDAITITYPLHRQNSMELRRGDEVFVKILMGSFALEFSTRVKSFRPDNVLLVNLEHPVEYTRIQRRSAVRMKTLINILIAPLPPNPENPDLPLIPKEEPLYIRATALDISAGGMEILANAPNEKDSFLLIKFDLEMDKKRVHNFSVTAQVRRLTQESPRRFRHGVEFLDLSRADSDKIFQYIFKKSAEKNYWKR
ncbi:MAG: flagellar brake protein [Bacillota bacterium]